MNAVIHVTRKLLNEFKINETHKIESLFLKLLNYESPGLERQRHYLIFIVTLAQMYCESTVRK